MGAGHAKDEGDVRDQPVADTEHRRPGATALQAPVLMRMVVGHVIERTD